MPPVSAELHAEVREIADVWAEAAMRMMERLLARQTARRRSAA